MRSVPGGYFVKYRISRKRPLNLTSVKAAKELGIIIHRSTKDMAEAFTFKRSVGIIEKNYYMFVDSKPRHCRHYADLTLT